MDKQSVKHVNNQINIFIPIPIIKDIIKFSDLEGKKSFASTCKIFSEYVRLLPKVTMSFTNVCSNIRSCLDDINNKIYIPDINNDLSGRIRCFNLPSFKEGQESFRSSRYDGTDMMVLDKYGKKLFFINKSCENIEIVDLVDTSVSFIRRMSRPGFRGSDAVYDNHTHSLYVIDSLSKTILSIYVDTKELGYLTLDTGLKPISLVGNSICLDPKRRNIYILSHIEKVSLDDESRYRHIVPYIKISERGGATKSIYMDEFYDCLYIIKDNEDDRISWIPLSENSSDLIYKLIVEVIKKKKFALRKMLISRNNIYLLAFEDIIVIQRC